MGCRGGGQQSGKDARLDLMHARVPHINGKASPEGRSGLTPSGLSEALTWIGLNLRLGDAPSIVSWLAKPPFEVSRRGEGRLTGGIRCLLELEVNTWDLRSPGLGPWVRGAPWG
jgi:hypothetical protein